MSLLYALNDEPIYAVVGATGRTAIASLECNATYAAASEGSAAQVVACNLIPRSTEEPGQVRLYGFFHCPCVYESAARLVSLHATKAGAWRAKHRHQWQRWEELRAPGYRRGTESRVYAQESVAVRPVDLQD